MVGIIVQLVVSWLIIRVTERNNLSVLGLRPTVDRIILFIVFFLLTSLCCAAEFLMKIFPGAQEWILNPQFSFNLLVEAAWWNIKSVLFEELIFRGVLLYLLIKKIGTTKAIFISAIAFGIYHWFSFGVFGNIIQMLFVFVITGTMGLLLAFAFARTRSIYVPIAIHLGWNFTRIFIFSQGPIGNGMFIPASREVFRTASPLFYILYSFLPLVSALVLNFLLLRYWKRPSP